jgi:RNA 3'-terminal phosphate cyclase
MLNGCTKIKIDVGAPWDSREAPFFDDGVDIIKDPMSLSGEWAFRQRNWLEGRIQLSDSIAVVEIRSVQTASDAEGRQIKRIEVAVIEQLYGKNPNHAVSLESSENEPGYQLILRHERYLTGRFILFARWFGEKGSIPDAVGNHFHLSPASEVMLAEVTTRIQSRVKEEGKDGAREED